MRRLAHYTGTDWRTIQPWILFTNYQRYVDQFVDWSLGELNRAASLYTELTLPGGSIIRRGVDLDASVALAAAAPWHSGQ